MAELYQPAKGLLDEISKKVDPELTKTGYLQAEDTFRSMSAVFGQAGDVRKIALYASPFKRCTATALMISSSQFEPQDWSVWGLR